jgi:hypothetical protein
MNELKKECLGERTLIEVSYDGLRRLGRMAAHRQKPVGKIVPSAALLAAIDDARCDPSEVLYKNNPERNRRCPEFADHEWLYGLIGVDVVSPRVDIEPAVRVGNERPGHLEDTRVIRERAVGKCGELSIVARR